MKIRDGIWCVIAAFWLAVLFVTAIFLTQLIRYVSFAVSMAYLVVAAGFYGFILVSRDGKMWGLKLFFSLPLVYAVLQYFWKTEFAVRALNWVYADHGRASAGENFAGGFSLLVQLALFFIATVAAFSFRPKNTKVFERLQMLAGTLVAVGLIVVVLALENAFPETVTVLKG